MNWLKSVMRKFRKFLQLDWPARLFFLQAMILIPLVTLSLKFRGVRKTRNTLAGLMPLNTSIHPDEINPAKLKSTTKMVQVAAGIYPSWANCLKKSLVLWGLLRRQGINCELRIGVSKASDDFEAHAWVEYQGIAINDTKDVRSRYAMFDMSIEQGFKIR